MSLVYEAWYQLGVHVGVDSYHSYTVLTNWE